MTFAVMVLAGVAGALTRFAAERTLDAGRVPWGLVAVNVAGSALLGALVALAAEQRLATNALLVLGTGFCGALTTFSGFSLATVRLAERNVVKAAVFAFGLLAVCVAAAAAGAALAGVR